MARRGTHVVVGAPVGVTAAAYMAWQEPAPARIAEAIGGGFGGVLGAMFPDVLEPAISSWHRSIAHSYTAGVTVTAFARAWVAGWQEYCRNEADWHDRLREQTSDGWERAWHSLCALFWRMLSGFLVGLAAGYASHLVLDAMTPRSLPLLF